ncbi:MAG: hypothetical protein ABIM19_07895 [candidate division WOR-3 bacterium]
MAFTRRTLNIEDGYRDIYTSAVNEVLDCEIAIPAPGSAGGFPKFLLAVSILDTAESPTDYSHDVYLYRKCAETGEEEPIDYIDFSANNRTSGSCIFPEGERWLFRPGDSLVVRGSVDTHDSQQVVVDWISEP